MSQPIAGDPGKKFTLSVTVTRGADGKVSYGVKTTPKYLLVEDHVRAALPGDLKLKQGVDIGSIVMTRDEGNNFTELVEGVTFGDDFNAMLVGYVDDGLTIFVQLAHYLAQMLQGKLFQAEVGNLAAKIFKDLTLLAQLGELEVKGGTPCAACHQHFVDSQDEMVIGGPQGSMFGGLFSFFGKLFDGGVREKKIIVDKPQGLVFCIDGAIFDHVFFEACGGVSLVKDAAIKAIKEEVGNLIEAEDSKVQRLAAGIVEGRRINEQMYRRNLGEIARATVEHDQAVGKLSDKRMALIEAGLDLPELKATRIEAVTDVATGVDDDASGDGLPDPTPQGKGDGVQVEAQA